MVQSVCEWFFLFVAGIRVGYDPVQFGNDALRIIGVAREAYYRLGHRISEALLFHITRFSQLAYSILELALCLQKQNRVIHELILANDDTGEREASPLDGDAPEVIQGTFQITRVQ